MSLSKPEMEKSVENYSFFQSDIIGKGFSSTVFQATNRNDQSSVAVKVIDLRGLKQSTMQALLQSEITILRSLTHPNILSCQDIFLTVNNCYIVTELCKDGDLASIIKKKGRLRGMQALKLMKDIIDGYLYLQQKKILHRDLKPANILLKNDTAKIADFGFACHQDQKNSKKYNVGTPLYMSPETLFHNKYSKQNDIWSIGVIFYEMLQGRSPWDVRTEQELKLIMKKQNEVRFRVAIRDEIQDLIKRCLKYDSKDRIGSKQIKEIIQKIIKEMEQEDTSVYRGTLTKRPVNLPVKRKVSNSTVETLEKQNFQSHIRKADFQSENQTNLERKKTKGIQERSEKQKRKGLVRSTNQPMYTKNIEEASRYNHKLLKAGINLTRYIYKLFPRIEDLYCQQTVRKSIKEQIAMILLPLIELLGRCMNDKILAQSLGFRQFENFTQTVCYTKTITILTEYNERYRKYILKDFPAYQYKMKAIFDELSLTRKLRMLILQIPLDDRTSDKHNICVDYLISLIVLLELFSEKKFDGLAKEGYLEEIIDTTPVKLDPQSLSQLAKKRESVCKSN